MFTLDGIKSFCNQAKKEVKNYFDTITPDEIAAITLATVSVVVFIYEIKKMRESRAQLYIITFDEATSSYTFTPVEDEEN